jgi:hypothetical protein
MKRREGQWAFVDHKKIRKYLPSLKRECPYRQGAPRDFEISGFVRIDKFA